MIQKRGVFMALLGSLSFQEAGCFHYTGKSFLKSGF